MAVKKIEKILVPTDLSERSLTGVAYALNLAKTYFLRYGEKLRDQIAKDSEFRVPDPHLKEYELALKRFLAEHFADLIPSIRVHEQMEVGDRDEKIALETNRQKADLIVLSARERTGLARFLTRDVIGKLTRKVKCPVLSIRLEENEAKLRAA